MLLYFFVQEKNSLKKKSCATKSCDSGCATTGGSNCAGAQTFTVLFSPPTPLFC